MTWRTEPWRTEPCRRPVMPGGRRRRGQRRQRAVGSPAEDGFSATRPSTTARPATTNRSGRKRRRVTDPSTRSPAAQVMTLVVAMMTALLVVAARSSTAEPLVNPATPATAKAAKGRHTATHRSQPFVPPARARAGGTGLSTGLSPGLSPTLAFATPSHSCSSWSSSPSLALEAGGRCRNRRWRDRDCSACSGGWVGGRQQRIESNSVTAMNNRGGFSFSAGARKSWGAAGCGSTGGRCRLFLASPSSRNPGRCRNAALFRPALAARSSNGPGEPPISPSAENATTAKDESTISTLLNAISLDFSPSSSGTRRKNLGQNLPRSTRSDGGEEGEGESLYGETEEGSTRSAGGGGGGVTVPTPTVPLEGEEKVEEEGEEGVASGEASAEEEGTGEGTEQERGRKRDMYKIRSLLLQGQVAGLRERLKERELDVKELRVLTGGRGQSKLRELGAMLKQARGECDALRAREKSLAEELKMSQKEGDTLRGDLLANQKALSDLNVYADSLRSRYTAEMVKLEASLEEMERELTRAEAAHMRERRELLDREAAAVADQELFRSRSILLQGEVMKTRARETSLRRENARLVETSSVMEAEREAAKDDLARQNILISAATNQQQQQQQQEQQDKDASDSATVLSLEQDNAALRLRLEALSAGGGGGGVGDGGGFGSGGQGGNDASSAVAPPHGPLFPQGDRDSGVAGVLLPRNGRRGLFPWISSSADEDAPTAAASSAGVGGDGAVVVDAIVNEGSGDGGGSDGAGDERVEAGGKDINAVKDDVGKQNASGEASSTAADAAVAAVTAMSDGDSNAVGPKASSREAQEEPQVPPTPPPPPPPSAVGTSAASKTVIPKPVGTAARVVDDTTDRAGPASPGPQASDKASAVAFEGEQQRPALTFKNAEEEQRALREAGVNRVVEGLRAENARLRQRLRTAEHAAAAGEDRANYEAERADDLEAELGRVRVTVKGRVKALKAALEEAEEDADRLVAEKEEFMVQWEEDVDALRQQLGSERTRREEDRRELEGAIFDLEDEVEELKERDRQRRKSAAKKKRGGGGRQSRQDTSRSSGIKVGGGGRDGADEPAVRRRTESETKKRSEERSRKVADAKNADQQWRKAMTLLQYLD